MEVAEMLHFFTVVTTKMFSHKNHIQSGDVIHDIVKNSYSICFLQCFYCV